MKATILALAASASLALAPSVKASSPVSTTLQQITACGPGQTCGCLIAGRPQPPCPRGQSPK